MAITITGTYQGREYFLELYPENKDKMFTLFCKIFRKKQDGSKGMQLISHRNWPIYNANRDSVEYALDNTKGK